jgi:hypothetical protein
MQEEKLGEKNLVSSVVPSCSIAKQAIEPQYDHFLDPITVYNLLCIPHIYGYSKKCNVSIKFCLERERASRTLAGI